MKKIMTFLGLLFCVSSSFSQNTDSTKQAVLQTMTMQQNAWNKGDIEGFMEGYWKSDSLQFVGKEITYGWQHTLERYKKSYPTKEAMGTLEFSDIQIQCLSENAIFVTGAWNIVRSDRTAAAGHYTLLFKKIDGKWLIVVDHTS